MARGKYAGADDADVISQRPDQRSEIASVELFGGAMELLIRHGGESYRLRITKLNKLILTK